MRRLAACLVATAVLATGCGGSTSKQSGSNGTVVVFAAASLKDTFTTLAARFERAYPGTKVVPSFGGSDTLAAQIVQGAPVDVFASANPATMQRVAKAGDAENPADFVENRLEIAVPAGNPRHVASLADLAKSGVKLALCATSVPCGAAAIKAIDAAHVKVHPVTLEQDVTAVLTKVELGEVDAGLVYRTDVRAAGGKVTGIDFPEAAQAVNSYRIAVVTTGKNRVAARAFVDFVLSSAAQKVFASAGFEPVTSP